MRPVITGLKTLVAVVATGVTFAAMPLTASAAPRHPGARHHHVQHHRVVHHRHAVRHHAPRHIARGH